MIRKKFRERCLFAALNIWRNLERFSMKQAKKCLEDSDWYMRKSNEFFENMMITLDKLEEMSKE